MPRKPKPPEDFLYTLQTGAESYIVTKWDNIGLEQLSQYIMPIINYDESGDDEVSCTCPRGLSPSCRHRDMLPKLLPIIDQPAVFYCFGHDRYLRIEDGTMKVGITSSQEPLGAPARALESSFDLPESEAISSEVQQPIGQITAKNLAIAEREGELDEAEPIAEEVWAAFAAPFKRRV